MIEFCESFGWGTLLDYGVAATEIELAQIHDKIDSHDHLYSEDGNLVAYSNIRLGPHDIEPQRLVFASANNDCMTGK